MVEQKPILVGRIFFQDEAMGVAQRGSPPYGRYLLVLLFGTKEGNLGFMVLRVRPINIRCL